MNVICFGGGTGLSTLLLGLKRNPFLTCSAAVTVFDTGGSSGNLRDRFGILPPGDILKCLVALSDDERATRELLLRRINCHKQPLPRHTAGNVLLLGLEKVYGDFATAVRVLGQVISIRGRVYPVTTAQSTLCCTFDDDSNVRGETAIDAAITAGAQPSRMFLDPPVRCTTEIKEALADANVICIGPGSFYTSVIPPLLPTGIREQISASRAPIIFIANLLTEGIGMQGYTAGNTAVILEQYLGRSVDRVVVNTSVPDERLNAYAAEHKYPLAYHDIVESKQCVAAELWTDGSLARHDSDRLAFLIGSIIFSFTKNP
jgi:uncharacterized cofD-like protein